MGKSTKTEIRMPKEIRNPKSECQISNSDSRAADSGLRKGHFSDFGFCALYDKVEY